jgi:hypothetical protein
MKAEREELTQGFDGLRNPENPFIGVQTIENSCNKYRSLGKEYRKTFASQCRRANSPQTKGGAYEKRNSKKHQQLKCQ